MFPSGQRSFPCARRVSVLVHAFFQAHGAADRTAGDVLVGDWIVLAWIVTGPLSTATPGSSPSTGDDRHLPMSFSSGAPRIAIPRRSGRSTSARARRGAQRVADLEELEERSWIRFGPDMGAWRKARAALREGHADTGIPRWTSSTSLRGGLFGKLDGVARRIRLQPTTGRAYLVRSGECLSRRRSRRRSGSSPGGAR